MGWQFALHLQGCLCLALFAELQANGIPSPANSPILTYNVDLRLEPQQRWVAVLEDFIIRRGTIAFSEFYSSVLTDLENTGGDAFAYYRKHVHDFMAAYEKHLPDAYGEIISLADVLSSHAATPREKQLFSRETVFLAQQHMEIMSIAPKPPKPPEQNSSLVNGKPRNGECTSVLVRRPGKPFLHFRNWDFGPEPKALGTASVQVDFQDASGGFRCLMALTHITKFTTCIRPGAYAMSLNAREYGVGYERGRAPSEQLQLLREGRLPREGVLRKVMFSHNYKQAVEAAENAEAMTSLYVILSSGEGIGEGVVVTVMGNRSKADVWPMSEARSDDSWFLVQTNVDHWLSMSEQHYSSHRREHVKAKLRQLGPQASTKELFEVLQDSSVFPADNTGSDDGRIFRPTTVASVLMKPSVPFASPNTSWTTIVWQALADEIESTNSLLV